MVNEIFCTKCGAAMREDMNFCPKCGAVVAGSETEKQQVEEMRTMARESGFMWVKFLLMIYAIPVIFVAILAIINAGANADLIWNDSHFQDYIHSRHLDWTVDTVKNIIIQNASMGLVSGIAASVALVCTYLRKYWVVGFIGCIVATVFSVWSFIGIFIGIFVTWMYFDLKTFFEPMGKKDEAPKAEQ